MSLSVLSRREKLWLKRWSDLPWTPSQRAYMKERTKHRFVVNHSGRRGGKSEIEKRYLMELAQFHNPDGLELNYLFSAPTQVQAVRIFWQDVKALAHPAFIESISEVYKTVRFHNGSSVIVAGMDAPERIEGIALTHAVLDEYGNMKEGVWDHLYPMFGDVSLPWPGTAALTGVPEGRNHYFGMHKKGLSPDHPTWMTVGWPSWDVLSPEVIAEARRDLDDRSFRQEFGGEFVDFAGQCYYDFSHELHASERLEYDPALPLILAFDFNVEPGTASIIQEQYYTGTNVSVASDQKITCIIDEVWIPRSSNTPAVCREILKRYQNHPGDVICYGDPAGGNRSTSQTDGNDWDLITQYLAPCFGDRLDINVPKAHPLVRNRLNAMNSRIMNADRQARLLVDPRCTHTIEDFEGVRLLEGTTDQLDKRTDKMLTHLTDGIGYYVFREFPLEEIGGGYSTHYY